MEEAVITVVKSVMNLNSLDFGWDTDFESLGIDSIVKVELAVALEDEFNIDITKAERKRLSSINEVIKLVGEKVKQ